MKRTARNTGTKQAGTGAKVPTHADLLKVHLETRRQLMEGVEVVCERHGDEASFYYEALALTPADEIVLFSCSCEGKNRQPITPFESVVWMGHCKWAEKFDSSSAVYDAATSRWLLLIARAMSQRNASVVSRRHGSGVFVITLTRELSEQWEAASKAARIPLDWMLYDTLKGDVEHYLADGTGYAKDSRELWEATKKKAKVPIQIVKA